MCTYDGLRCSHHPYYLFPPKTTLLHAWLRVFPPLPFEQVKLSYQRVPSIRCEARRRVRYEDNEGDDDEEYGHNEEIAMLELYSQSAREEALLVRAMVDEQEAEVLIFKGFSSCLSYGTSPDPSKSILPARAVIKSIDRIRGPFNPSNIEYS
ncbi:hypothetical protein L1049_005678 [Liquidambar formosana]|uniref:DUF7734 domain-containing protein n=1 Tax=Liquidambar formosana TaxID=63359 RepID=A0AAP0RE23_LIQFO